MADFIFLMHDDGEGGGEWDGYLSQLRASGCFQGGSSVGGGLLARKSGDVQSTSTHLTGYIRVEADDLAHARALLAGNPVYESGGTVEIRELRRD